MIKFDDYVVNVKFARTTYYIYLPPFSLTGFPLSHGMPSRRSPRPGGGDLSIQVDSWGMS